MALIPHWRAFALAVLVAAHCTLLAQSTGTDAGCCDSSESQISRPSATPDHERLPGNYMKRFVGDQKTIWTSPLRLKKEQVPPLVAFGAGLAALTQIDRDIEKHASNSHASLISHGSDAGVAMFAGAAGTFYLFGAWKKDDHARETGLLTSEAAINALFVSTALQTAFRRARPQDNGAGDFFHGGSSFPSNHSAVAWAAASVVAREYPGWGTKLLSYGLASAISAARVGGRQHFASDVVLGSTLGWFIGNQVYRTRHDPDLPGHTWGTVGANQAFESVANPMHQASTYVPIDSPLYDAFDRLAALGFATRGFQGMRPWTRTEFARLLQAAESIDKSASPEAEELYQSLRKEFASDTRMLNGERNLSATIDSVYTRFTNISGVPLTDGFHFGQTTINDYGRPYQQGQNVITGLSTHAEAGPFAFYVRAEYQHAPSAPALADSVRLATAATDGLPASPDQAVAVTNRVRLLDSYVALNLYGWQASFGKQSLWWGPGRGGDLMYSNNAEPITMLRLSRITPFRLPSILGMLGDIRSESFLGQLDGYHFLRLGPTFVLTGSYDNSINPQPYIWGQKVSLQPTANLEIGVSMTTVFAGLGRPLTWRTFLHSLSTSGNAQPIEPGDRRTGFDFSYRIPGLRKWLVLYNGSMAEDQPNPVAYPRHSAMNPGIYLPQIPKLRKLDLHLETGYTNLPNDPRSAVFYTNVHYAGGYTNYGQIMGSWLGPEARGYQVWSNYWRSGESKIQFGYRKQTVDPAYAGGGLLQDVSGRYDFLLRPTLAVNAGMQYERWNFPVQTNRTESNFAVSVQITYRPARIIGRNR